MLSLALITATPASSAIAQGTSEPKTAALIQPDQYERQLDIGRKLLLTEPQHALDVARQVRRSALVYQRTRSTVIVLARSDWLAGAALIQLNRINEALGIINRGLESGLARLDANSKLEGDLLLAKSQVLSNSGHVEQALRNLLRAFSIYSAAGELRSQSVTLQNIASLYTIARDFDRALSYYKQASEIFSQDPVLLISSHANIAEIFIQQDRFDDAEQELRLALAQADKIGSPVLKARFLANLAQAQMRSGKLSAASISINTALAMAKNGPMADWRPVLYGTAAEVALRDRNVNQAKHYVELAFKGVDLSSANYPVRDALHSAYEVYRITNDYPRALTYLEAYQRVDDQARAVAASASAALMAARFDYANQNLKIAQRDATIANASARLRATVLQGVGLAGTAIFGLLLFGYVSIRRSRDQVRAANDDLSTTNVALEKALAARTEFLAMTSHEIRTPLNGVLGMTQVLLADRALDPPVRDKVELVHSAGETMKALVDDLLDVAKMSSGEIVVHKAPMGFAKLLNDASRIWSGQAQTRGVSLALNIADAPARIIEDEVRLRQIVFNLMSNAIKFTDAGEVRLSARATADATGGERLQVVVADSGIGIPADKLEEIFESFRQVDSGTTRRHSGTGLGLSICRSLARALGGDVTVDSVEGQGSTFTLDLPLTRLAPEQQPTGCEKGDVGLECVRLLLVEANPLAQSVLRAVLAPQVKAFEAVASADDALARLADDGADLVLADGATLRFDLDMAAALQAAVARTGGHLALLWPTPDAETRSTIGEAMLPDPIAKPIAAPDLVSALKSIYASHAAPDDLATQAA